MRDPALEGVESYQLTVFKKSCEGRGIGCLSAHVSLRVCASCASMSLRVLDLSIKVTCDYDCAASGNVEH